MASITHPEFGPKTTATEVARAFKERVKGKTFVVTGVSPNSLGEGLALSLASQSPGLLILASRTQSKLDAIVQAIWSKYPNVSVKTVLLDLASQESVRAAAAEIKGFVRREGRGIDVLFNNAGINIGERRLTPEGIELQFGTSHVGPFLLTNLLMPLLLRNKGARIVMTSSEAHRISPVRFSDYNQEPGRRVEREDEPRRGLPEGILRGDGGYEPSVAYGQSKTANVLFAVGLNRRLGRERGVESFAVMPGTIMTYLARELDEETAKGLLATMDFWKDIDQGAATMLVAAFDPLLSAERGVYLDDCQVKRPSKWAADPEKAERLWSLSEDLVGEKFSYTKKSRL